MQWQLAFWVMLGIPISFLGALALLPVTGVSINMISLFAFILSLGIVVDDAIIVGENIYSHRLMGKPRLQAAIEGTTEVGSAVVFSVLTSVAAFMPMLFVSGSMGKFMYVIPVIVIAVLLLSLVESLLILPAHLSHGSEPSATAGQSGKASRKQNIFVRSSRSFSYKLQMLIEGPYRRSMAWSLRNRYVTLAFSIGLLMLSIGLVKGGFVKIVHMPSIDDENITANLEMPFGIAFEETRRFSNQLVTAAESVAEQLDTEYPDAAPSVLGVYESVGSSIGGGGPSGGSTTSSSNIAAVRVKLQPSDKRPFRSEEFANRWREALGEIPGAKSLKLKSSMIRVGDDIDVQLEHSDFDSLKKALGVLRAELSKFSAVSDLAENFSEGKRELSFKLKPEAETRGVTARELGRQLRSAFYGAEALRLQRNREEVRVMVRYPESERQSLSNLEAFRVRTPRGGEIPFSEVAEVSDGQGFGTIRRSDRKRVVNLTAEVDESQFTPREILDSLEANVFPGLREDFPGLSIGLEGGERERKESMQSLYQGFAFAMLLVYCLLAIPFKSYFQPFIVMSAIPFGFVGALGGHLLLGHNISLLSMCGLVALSGVVVNDSLLLVDYVNRQREEHNTLAAAVLSGGERRFRQITLTSLTTFFGLTPIIFETSLQAQFLIPMAISLGFGVLFATFITLYLIPSLYLICEDLSARIRSPRSYPAA